MESMLQYNLSETKTTYFSLSKRISQKIWAQSRRCVYFCMGILCSSIGWSRRFDWQLGGACASWRFDINGLIYWRLTTNNDHLVSFDIFSSKICFWHRRSRQFYRICHKSHIFITRISCIVINEEEEDFLWKNLAITAWYTMHNTLCFVWNLSVHTYSS